MTCKRLGHQSPEAANRSLIGQTQNCARTRQRAFYEDILRMKMAPRKFVVWRPPFGIQPVLTVTTF